MDGMMKTAALIVALTLILIPLQGLASVDHSDAPRDTITAKAKKPTFKLASKSAKLAKGSSGTATVTVTPLNGYKWNKDYPAKLTFASDPKTVSLAKKVFKQVAGDFKAGEKATAVPVDMKAAAAGQETLKAQMKFSVCNETACVIEKADVQIAVSVSP
jgi:hypothetical protein